MLPGQKFLWQLKSVQDSPINLHLKFHQNRVSNSWDITDIEFLCCCWVDVELGFWQYFFYSHALQSPCLRMEIKSPRHCVGISFPHHYMEMKLPQNVLGMKLPQNVLGMKFPKTLCWNCILFKILHPQEWQDTHTANCMLLTSCCKLHVANCLMQTACCKLHVINCMLQTACFKLHVANCILQTPC